MAATNLFEIRHHSSELDGIYTNIEEEGVRFIQLQFMDIRGVPKNVSIPVSRLDTLFDDGVVFDGSSILGYATIEESDLILHPDPETYVNLPWLGDELKTARLVCNIYDSNGKRFEGDPRFVLQRQLAAMDEKRQRFNTGPEFEFFLFKLDENDQPTTELDDFGGYFDLIPLTAAETVRKLLINALEDMGYPVEASHHEVAPSQHEIDLRYADALTSADRIMTLKNATKEIAFQHGLYASFMPKPIHGICGSGMHVHASITKKDRNLFDDPSEAYGISTYGQHFIGGLLEHARSSCAVLASWVNSYKRLVPGFEAPTYITWANLNRSALVRVPAGRGLKSRAEVRNPDSAGNPYLQFAVILAAGLDGIRRELDPPEPVERDIFRMKPDERRASAIEELPENLGVALDAFESSELMRETLGNHIFRHFLHIKRAEYREYREQVTRWEIENLLSIL